MTDQYPGRGPYDGRGPRAPARAPANRSAGSVLFLAGTLGVLLVAASAALGFVLVSRSGGTDTARLVVTQQTAPQASPSKGADASSSPRAALPAAPTRSAARSSTGGSDAASTPGAVDAQLPTDVAALDARPHVCEEDWSPLGCSYRFQLDGQDLVPATAGAAVHARLALVGPAYATDTSGQRVVLLRVRVSALLGRVSIDPSEFILGATYSSSTPASTAPVAGVPDQVVSRVSVAAGSDFVGTLAFPDQPGQSNLHAAWLRASGEPAATWTVS